MKICVLGTRGFPFIQGGVEKHCESLYPLVSPKFNIIIFRRKSYVNSTETYPNITFIDLPSTKFKGFETVIHSFLATCRAISCKPNIVHIHNIGPAMFAPILKWCQIKVVLTYHSPNYEHKKWGKIARNILKCSEKIALSHSDAIIFVNKFQMEKYDKAIQQKSYYLPNGIPQITPSIKKDYIKELGLKPSLYLLAVGRITQEKGFDCLIKAFNQLDNYDYKLVIAGGIETESTYGKELRKICNSDKVVFTGYVYGEKLNQLYTNARLFVLPSYNEGFPLVLLEAMSFHLNVLVSDIPATHLVSLDINDYFSKGDADQLAMKIKQKLKTTQNLQYDLKAFEWKTIAKDLENIYTNL